jgi:putative transposase
VQHVRQRLGISERRACRTIGQSRSSQRYLSANPKQDKALVDRIRKLAKKHRRYGYRRIHAILVREGWRVNRKKVQRLWRNEGLRVPQKQQKRRRLGTTENGTQRLGAERRNHVWSYDFTMDQTADGKRLKMMPVVDEFTRECLAIEVERTITAEGVIDTLRHLFRIHGEPAYIRSDNGPEFIAKAVREWLAASGVGTLYIEPGSPWQNAYVETFNGKLEDDCWRARCSSRWPRRRSWLTSTGWSTTTSGRTARWVTGHRPSSRSSRARLKDRSMPPSSSCISHGRPLCHHCQAPAGGLLRLRATRGL